MTAHGKPLVSSEGSFEGKAWKLGTGGRRLFSSVGVAMRWALVGDSGRHPCALGLLWASSGLSGSAFSAWAMDDGGGQSGFWLVGVP